MPYLLGKIFYRFVCCFSPRKWVFQTPITSGIYPDVSKEWSSFFLLSSLYPFYSFDVTIYFILLPYLWHMEPPRSGSYATAAATLDPLTNSAGPGIKPTPLQHPKLPVRFLTHCAMAETPYILFCVFFNKVL